MDSVTLSTTKSLLNLSDYLYNFVYYLQLIGYEPGCSYQLVKNDTFVGSPVQDGTSATWSGQYHGDYKVMTRNEWGCTSVTNRFRISEQEAPAAFTFGGGATYCKGASDMKRLELSGSIPGVIYCFYRQDGHFPMATLMGTGNVLSIDVPAEPATYYVTAQDTTPERCEAVMPGQATITENPFAVRGNPSPLRVAYGESVVLNILVTGGTATTYSWEPAEKLLVADVSAPQTVSLLSGEMFHVSVIDTAGCTATGVIEVTVDGGPVKAIIKDHRMNDVDTLYVCAGSPVELYGGYDGGTEGEYTCSWSDNNVEIGQEQWLRNYKKEQSGYLYYRVQRGHLSAMDSICIELLDAVTPYEIANSGVNCITDGNQVIRLNRSETGVHYRLEYRRECNGTSVIMAETDGNNGLPLEMAVPDGGFGCYRIYGEKTHGIHRCTAYMTGVVELRPSPKIYEVSGDAVYCDGRGVTDIVRLSGSEPSAVYELYRGTVRITAKTGNGNTLAFTGNFGTGDYTVTSVLGSCRQSMSGGAAILVKPLPAERGIAAAGSYCPDECPVAIVLDSVETGVSYRLYRDSSGVVIPVHLLTAGLTFGSYCDIGRYYIEGDKSGCTTILKDTVVIGGPPRYYHLSSDPYYCYGDPGAILQMAGSEPGHSYVLQHLKAGSFEDIPDSAVQGDGMPVLFTVRCKSGSYRVTDHCRNVITDTFTVSERARIDNTVPLILTGNPCSDSIITISLPTVSGVSYSLWKDLQQVGNQVIVSSGGTHSFTFQATTPGQYTVKAEQYGCQVWLSGKINTGILPAIPVLPEDTAVCSGTTGVLQLANYQPTTIYRLIGESGETVSSGSVMSGVYTFSAVPPGRYYVTAANTGCTVHSRAYTLNTISLPELTADNWEVSHCAAADEGVISLQGLSEHLSYIVHSPSLTETIEIKNTTGAHTAGQLPLGTYRLTAYDPVTRCTSIALTDTIREAVPVDSIAVSPVYCETESGALLQLSGVNRDVEYRILTSEGILRETIIYPTMAFTKAYRSGNYIFHKMRMGAGGGCSSQEPMNVEKENLPTKDLKISLSGAEQLCEGTAYQVTLKASQKGIGYTLSHQENGVIETIMGNGGDTTFNFSIRMAGNYNILASGLSGCRVNLDTVIRIHPLPLPVTVYGDVYCYDPVFGSEEPGGHISLGGIKADVNYILTTLSDEPLDTIVRPENHFRAQSTGIYCIKAVDPASGCFSEIGQAEIQRHVTPQIFKVGNLCGTRGLVQTIDGSEGDSVSYQLYRDGLMIGTPLTGTGGNISFGMQHNMGIYRIRAEKQNGCSSWMKDSVRIYTTMDTCTFLVEGELCIYSTQGVSLIYPCGVAGWNYYLSDGVRNSDTLVGGTSLLKWQDSPYLRDIMN